MYSKIKIHGDCDYNYIWSKQGQVSFDDITAIASNGVHTPTWDTTTITLSTFSTDLSASDTSQETPITKFVVQRYDTKRNMRYPVTEVPTGKSTVLDYNVGGNGEYQYYIFPIYEVDGNEVYGNPITSDIISIDWDSWFVIGLNPTEDKNAYIVDNDNIWKFQLNVVAEEFGIEHDTTILPSFGRFPKAHSDKRDYLTNRVSCYLGDISCSGGYYSDDIIKIEKWRNFCKNGQLKLLKDRKGHVIPCQIQDRSYKVDEQIIEMPTTISFSFVELMDSKEISVYGLEDI